LLPLAVTTAWAMALAERLRWDSLARGDTAAFATQATIVAELCQFDIGVRSLSRLRRHTAPKAAGALAPAVPGSHVLGPGARSTAAVSGQWLGGGCVSSIRLPSGSFR
jgi:hypothetical protein